MMAISTSCAQTLAGRSLPSQIPSTTILYLLYAGVYNVFQTLVLGTLDKHYSN